MELNINASSYYTKEFGIDDEIYQMCRELSRELKGRKYSDIIGVIGIIPIIAPAFAIQKGLYNERKRFAPKCGFAFVSLQIDYEAYIKADISGKKRLMIDNILKSVKSISKRAKMEYRLFEDDIKRFCENYDIPI